MATNCWVYCFDIGQIINIFKHFSAIVRILKSMQQKYFMLKFDICVGCLVRIQFVILNIPNVLLYLSQLHWPIALRSPVTYLYHAYYCEDRKSI